MPTFFLKTYGCQMNERDSEQVARMLAQRGFARTPYEEEADVILINTCSVRDQAEQKALGKMGLMGRHRQRDPRVVYGFLGCMAQSRGAELMEEVPHLDLVVGTQKFHRVADYVEEIWEQKCGRRMDDLRSSIVDVEEEEASQNTIRDHSLQPAQATAFVSIMQGCNMKCTFCIVPSTRGKERGRPIAEIVAEVEELAARGVKEVTLLGQIVNLYGRREFPKVDGKSPFVQLLEAVNAVEGIERIRFTSPHPMGYAQDLINAFGYLPKLAEHIHLPLQSGSDRILKRMHRPYTGRQFRELVKKIRAVRPEMAITTDIIVGFPGESEEDFVATRDLCAEVGFDNAFIFKYSPRRDTPAAEMAEQVTEEVKKERNRDLLEVVNAIARAKNEALVGQRVEVLCEGPSKNNLSRLSGRTRGNKIVIFEGPERLCGEIFEVQIQETTGFTLYGDPCLATE